MLDNRMREKGLTYTMLAAKTGISYGYLYDLIKGYRGSRSIMKWAPKLAEALDMDIEEVVAEIQGKGGSRLEHLEDMVQVQFADIAAGHGIPGNQICYLSKSLLNTDKVIGYRVRGSSMEPEIPEDSIIVVDLETKLKDGQIVVAWIGGEGMVKRLVYHEGRMLLVGKTGDRIIVDGSVHIEGAVIFVGKFL